MRCSEHASTVRSLRLSGGERGRRLVGNSASDTATCERLRSLPFSSPLLSPPESAHAPVVSLACHHSLAAASWHADIPVCEWQGQRQWAVQSRSTLHRDSFRRTRRVTDSWAVWGRTRSKGMSVWVSQLSPTLRRLNTGQQQYDVWFGSMADSNNAS